MGAKASFDPAVSRKRIKQLAKGNPFPSDPTRSVIQFSSGKSEKTRQDTRKQENQIAFQKQKEDLRLATSEDEISKRKAMAKGKTTGRSLLTATSPTGVQGLGG